MPFAGRRVLVVAAFDSFFRAGAFFADHLEERGAAIKYLTAHVRRGQLSEDQARAAGLPATPEVMPLQSISDPSTLDQFDIVLLALDGARVRRFMIAVARHYTKAHAAKRPLVVSFYPGLIFRFHYEGMFCRMSSDLLLLNSQHDYDLYRAVRDGLGLSSDNALLAGLSVVPSVRQRQRQVPDDGAILFVGQPTVPAWRHERMYLVDRLVTLAERYPTTPVIIKPRHRRGETTLHKEHDHFEDLVAEVAKYRTIPSNLRVEYGRMHEVLMRARVCLTVSSTAALEALALNIPTRVISDFGVHEHLGTQFFLGSGLLAELDSVRPDLPFVLNEGWYGANVTSASDRLEEIGQRLLALLKRRDAESHYPLHDTRLFGRPPAFDEYVRQHFDEPSLGLVAEGRTRKRRWAERFKRLRGSFMALSRSAGSRFR